MKKSRIKWILIPLFIFVLLAGISIIYIILPAKQEQNNPLALIPNHAIVIAETNNPWNNWQEVRSSEPWKYIQTHPYLQEMMEGMSDFDTLFQKNENLMELLNDRTVYFSMHLMPNLELGYLYAVDLKSLSRLALFKTQLKNWLEPEYLVTETTVNSHDLIEIYEPNSAERFFVSIIDRQLVVSYERKLLQEALDGYKDRDWYQADNFEELHLELEEDRVRFFIQFSELEDFLNRYAAEDSGFTAQLGQNFTFSGLNFSIDKDNVLQAEGSTLIAQNSKSYIEALHNSGSSERSAFSIAPIRTGLYLSYTFDNLELFIENLKASSMVDEKEVNSYEENIEKLSKFLDFDLMQSLIEWVDSEVSIFQFESAFEVNKIEMVLGLRVKDKKIAAEELDRFERQIRRKTPIKFETINYYNHEIRYLALKGFFKVFFGKLFQNFEKPYYTLINDVVVFADNPNALKTMIKSHVEETTLDYSQSFTKFNKRFNDQVPIFAYVNTPVLYETLLSYADYEMKQSLQKNKNYLTSFPQIGVELNTKEAGFESQMKASYLHFKDLEEIQDFETYHFEDIYDWPQNEEDAFFVGDIHPSDMEAKQYELFYSNGAMRIKVELKNGELNGDYVSYYPNGKKKMEGKFRKGKQQGLWRYYSSENKILERKRF
ncbi:MAG: hypothetical protein CMC18_09350 [Flavobacteriaceae bacterium]|nr:hypothetical protein [Flavobacteriaceae bacterium]